MSRGLWRRIGPWLTPAVVLAEVVLVSSGLVDIRNAVIALAVIETLFALTAVSRVVAAARAYRAGRAAGSDGWAAAEEALAQVMPRKLARLVLIEPRLFGCLVRWLTGRYAAPADDSFGYHRGLRPLLAVIVGLVVVEGAVADMLIAALVPAGPWVWIALGLHLYGLVWLVGFYASMVVRPHRLLADGLHLRDGVFTEVIVPYEAITGARAARRDNLGRSGLEVEPASGVGLFATGDATITLGLDPSRPVHASGKLIALSSLDITVDDAAGFLKLLRGVQQRIGEAPPLVNTGLVNTGRTSPVPARPSGQAGATTAR